MLIQTTLCLGNTFVQKSIVKINDANHKPEFKSSNQLTLKLGKADLKDLTTLKVKVFNPPPDGGESNVWEVTVE